MIFILVIVWYFFYDQTTFIIDKAIVFCNILFINDNIIKNLNYEKKKK